MRGLWRLCGSECTVTVSRIWSDARHGLQIGPECKECTQRPHAPQATESSSKHAHAPKRSEHRHIRNCDQQCCKIARHSRGTGAPADVVTHGARKGSMERRSSRFHVGILPRIRCHGPPDWFIKRHYALRQCSFPNPPVQQRPSVEAQEKGSAKCRCVS